MCTCESCADGRACWASARPLLPWSTLPGWRDATGVCTSCATSRQRHADRECVQVVLLCGLSWCRPCKSLTRPLEKLAAHYEGSVFLKVLGMAFL